MDASEPSFDDLTSRRILASSQDHWQLLATLAQSDPHIGVSSADLQALLSRIPALPDKVSREQRFISGHAGWINTTTTCFARRARGKDRLISLRHCHATLCQISRSTNFQKWEEYPNNGLALITIAWAYVFGVSLAERQDMPVRYVVPEESAQSARRDQGVPLDFGYATPEERTWWKAILSEGRGWIVDGETGGAKNPWTLSNEDLGIHVLDAEVSVTDKPPSSIQAASYIGRFCEAYDLGSQISAGLAAAICIPLQRVIMSDWSSKIDIPKPTLARPRANLNGEPCLPRDLKLLDYYMTLSLDTRTVGSALWSVFWSEGVPCNSVGAWFGPISDVVCPLLAANDHEAVAKILSLASPKVGPLWVGSALLGPNSLLSSIRSYLDRLGWTPSTGPDPVAAAWTGIPHSFLDNYTTRPNTDGTVSRTDVWRLSLETELLYLERRALPIRLPHCWPPYGRMREMDVEPEYRDHLRCSHHWEYSHWAWPGSDDAGFSSSDTLQPAFSILGDAPPEGGDPLAPQNGQVIPKNLSMDHIRRSEKATSKVVCWARKNIGNESGHGSAVFPDYGRQGEASSSVNALQAEMNNIARWVIREEEATAATAAAAASEFELGDSFMSDDSADFDDFSFSDEPADSDGVEEASDVEMRQMGLFGGKPETPCAMIDIEII